MQTEAKLHIQGDLQMERKGQVDPLISRQDLVADLYLYRILGEGSLLESGRLMVR